MKAMIGAELYNVAYGLIGAEKSLAVDVAAFHRDHPVPGPDLGRALPRPMRFTDSLGAELASLKQADIDALVTFSGNLATTRRNMDEVISGREPYGGLCAERLLRYVREDMRALANAFDKFAPLKQLRLGDNPDELVATALRRLSSAPRS